MSNELHDAVSKLEDLISHKELQELSLMRLKCEIREQKNSVKKLEKENTLKRLEKDKKFNEEPIEQVDVLPEKPVKVKKGKTTVKAIKN